MNLPFGNKMSDDEYEVDEAVYFVQLEGILDSELLNKKKFEKCKFLGTNTVKPVLYLDDYLFAGNVDINQGTAVFFEEKESIESGKNVKSLKYVCKTDKSYYLTQAFASEKKKENDETDKVTENDGTDIVTENEGIVMTDIVTENDKEHSNMDVISTENISGENNSSI